MSGLTQCCTMAREAAGSSVMMPSTPAPTKAQRSLPSLIVQTMKRRRWDGRVALTASRRRSSAMRKSRHDCTHDRFSPEGKARACHLIAVDGRRPCAQIYELGSLRIEAISTRVCVVLCQRCAS